MASLPGSYFLELDVLYNFVRQKPIQKYIEASTAIVIMDNNVLITSPTLGTCAGTCASRGNKTKVIV